VENNEPDRAGALEGEMKYLLRLGVMQLPPNKSKRKCHYNPNNIYPKIDDMI
jgi:hypothetical protein